MCPGRWLTLAFFAAAAALSFTSSSSIRFENTAAHAGVRFVLRDSATPDKHQIETMVGGVAVFDYDNDKYPDIYFTNGARQPDLTKADPSWYNRLYRNNRDGTFTDTTIEAGVRGEGFSMGVAAGDFDNDGYTDLFVTGVDRNTLFRNRGDGTFEDITRKAGLSYDLDQKKPWSISTGWFDYDNDGRLDLFVVNYCRWNPREEPPCSIGKTRTYCHPKYYAGLPNQLYHNNGNGTFTDVSAQSGISRYVGKGMALSFPDFDGDGRPDVFVANDTVPNFLFRNDGGGRFHEVGLQTGVAFNDDGRAVSSMGADARDVDNDGREDIFATANHNETFPLFHNLLTKAGALFSDITYPSSLGKVSITRSGWSNGLYDFNNDGYKDLFAACGAIDNNVEDFSNRKSEQPNLVMSNQGDGRFLDASAGAGDDFQTAGRHRGAAFGDFDNDGRVDVVVTRIGAQPELFHNISSGGNHWLALRLKGHRSNRQGIGALIHVVADSGREQWNRVTTATGYASSSSAVVFFGMGSARSGRTIDIQWPSGTRQTLKFVACDRYLDVEEP